MLVVDIEKGIRIRSRYIDARDITAVTRIKSDGGERGKLAGGGELAAGWANVGPVDVAGTTDVIGGQLRFPTRAQLEGKPEAY